MTNLELQELLSLFPDDLPIFVSPSAAVPINISNSDLFDVASVTMEASQEGTFLEIKF